MKAPQAFPMKKLANLLPFGALFILPLLFYPGVSASSWRSSSDVHVLIEFGSSLLAMTAGVMVLLHFFTTGHRFFLIIAIGFVLIGAEEFVHALFSCDRIWLETLPDFKLAVSSTWLGGNFVLAASFFLALSFGKGEILPANRARTAVAGNIIGLICATSVTWLIFHSPRLPHFVELGSTSKQLIELSLALLFFGAFLLHSSAYLKQPYRSPLLWSIIACIIFRVLAHLFVFDARAFYDAHWDAAHLLVFLSYFFPIFGVWGETIRLHQSVQAQVIELGKVMAERSRAEEALRQSRQAALNLMTDAIEARDQSEQMSQALRASEIRFRELFDHINSGVAVLEAVENGADFVLKDFNRAGQRIDQTSRQDVLGRRVTEAFPGVREMGLLEVFQRVWRTGQPEHHPVTLYRDERRVGWRENYVYRLPSGEVVAVYDDVTARQQAEEALRESEARFRIAQDMSPDGFTILRPVRDAQERVVDFIWVYENPTIARLNGTEEAAVVGRRLLELFPGHRGTPFLRAYQQVAESGETCIFEADYSGESMPNPTWFRIVVVPMTGDIAILAQDITERKRAEEELRTSHEQMRALAGHLQIAREDERTHLARELHDELAQELTRLKFDLVWLERRLAKSTGAAAPDSLVARVAEMSQMADTAILCVQRIATGLRPAVLDSLGLYAAVDWQTKDFQAYSKIACQVSVPAEEPPVSRDVATATYRILQESLTNVARHARATRVEVSLRQEADKIVLRVVDNGCGIPPDALSSPLAIGLAGMRERALLLGGQLEIRSQPGSGTIVTVRLPMSDGGRVAESSNHPSPAPRPS